jgi:hypothetical protein
VCKISPRNTSFNGWGDRGKTSGGEELLIPIDVARDNETMPPTGTE